MAFTPPGETRRRVHQFLLERLASGAPPTVREVQRAFGFRSVESARTHLEALVREGRLTKLRGKSRGYRLPVRGRAARPPRLAPLLGRVQAGDLTAAIEAAEGFVLCDAPPGGGELFALRVQGESMTGAGILPGDIVIVRRQPVAEPGEIVVALVDDEATVKRLSRQRGRWILQPENPHFEPIAPPPEALQLLGKVIEVRRRLESPPLLD